MAAPLAIAGAAIVVAGAIGQAYTAYSQGKSNRDYYRFLSEQSKLKSDLTMQAAEENVGYIQDQAARNSGLLRANYNQVESAQKAQMAAQGMALNSVTAEDIIKDNVSKMKLDEMAIRYNAELGAYQTRKNAIMQSFDLRAQAGSQMFSGEMAYWTGQQQGLSSLIGGAGNALMMYSSMSRGGSNDTRSQQQSNSGRG